MQLPSLFEPRSQALRRRGEGLVHTACACAGCPRKMWGTGYHRILSIRCIFRIRSPLTHRLLLLRWQNVRVLNNAHPNDRILTGILAPFVHGLCLVDVTSDSVTIETTHARAVCIRPSPLLRRAWERGYRCSSATS